MKQVYFNSSYVSYCYQKYLRFVLRYIDRLIHLYIYQIKFYVSLANHSNNIKYFYINNCTSTQYKYDMYNIEVWVDTS